MSFFGAIIGFIKNILKLITLIFRLITDPLRGVTVVLSFVIGLALYVVYLISLPFAKIFLPLLMFIVTFAFMILKIAAWFALFAALAVGVLVAWVADIFTGGAIMQQARCENLPDAWRNNPSFDRGNLFQRVGLCVFPCLDARFAPVSPYWAERLPDDQPSFCPQQLIARAAEEDAGFLATTWPLTMEFVPTLAFWRATEAAKEEKIREFYDRKMAHLSGCFRAHDRRSLLARNVCSNVDAFAPVGSEANARLRSLCREVFCKFTYDASAQRVRRREPSERLAASLCSDPSAGPQSPPDVGEDRILERSAVALVATVFVVVGVETLRRTFGIMSMRAAPSS